MSGCKPYFPISISQISFLRMVPCFTRVFGTRDLRILPSIFCKCKIVHPAAQAGLLVEPRPTLCESHVLGLNNTCMHLTKDRVGPALHMHLEPTGNERGASSLHTDTNHLKLSKESKLLKENIQKYD